MLSAWRQACAASGRHTSLSLRCKDGKREAERPGAMFVVVLAPAYVLRADEGNAIVAGCFCDTLSEFTLLQMIFN